MFNSMNQSRHDLKVGLHQAQQSYEHRLYELDVHHSQQLHQLRQRAQAALEEAEQRYQADVIDLRKRLEAEQSSRSAAQYHIESLQRNLKHLRDELEEKREEVSELPLLRETCRHQREELRELQKLTHEVPELKRQLEESQAAQKKLQDKLRKKEKSAAEKAYQGVAAAPYSGAGWSDAPSQMPWSEGGPGYDVYSQGYGDVAAYPAEMPPSGGAMPQSWEGPEVEPSYGETAEMALGPAAPQGAAFGDVHWAQQGVEPSGDAAAGGFPDLGTWSQQETAVKEKKKKKHRDKKAKKHEEPLQTDDFGSVGGVSTTPTMTDTWGEMEPASGNTLNIDAQVKMLKDMGFNDENRVRVVLEAVGNDVEKAVPVLLSEH